MSCLAPLSSTFPPIVLTPRSEVASTQHVPPPCLRGVQWSVGSQMIYDPFPFVPLTLSKEPCLPIGNKKRVSFFASVNQFHRFRKWRSGGGERPPSPFKRLIGRKVFGAIWLVAMDFFRLKTAGSRLVSLGELIKSCPHSARDFRFWGAWKKSFLTRRRTAPFFEPLFTRTTKVAFPASQIFF